MIQPIDPLKDKISKIEVIDFMGSDLSVVNAARVSMSKDSCWKNYEEGDLHDRDVKLINYLAKHKHWTPFSHPQVTLRIKMPIFIARQWFKHMVGFTRNEVSRRYVSDAPEFYVPTEWRKKADNVKQGSSEEPHKQTAQIGLDYDYVVDGIGLLYTDMIEADVCPEQARMVLPQSMYTEFIETGSLAAYARLANLRLDPHAQKEIQWYAQGISEIMSELFPVSWEALSHE